MIPKQDINKIPIDIIQKYNEENAKQYEDFTDAFSKDCCYLCGMKLSYFSPVEPCFHWLLLPDGIKKKHLIEYLKGAVGYFRATALKN